MRTSLHKHIPNLLTILRLAGTPLCIWFIAQNRLFAAFWVFFSVSVTDWFDGYLARRWQAISKFGQIMDPLADKCLVMTVYLGLGLWGFIPDWLVGLVLTRDLLILLCSIVLIKKISANPGPNLMGKISTTAQMLFAGLMLARGAPLSSFAISGIVNNLMLLFLYGVALLTILSGLAYGRLAIGALRKP